MIINLVSKRAHTVRNIVDRFIAGGSTVNLCALDISKAFDKVNHYALFIKLMKRRLPVEQLDLLIYWLHNCSSCIKWNGVLSQFYKQGSVLSPFLFADYLDDLFDYLSNNMSSFIIYMLMTLCCWLSHLANFSLC